MVPINNVGFAKRQFLSSSNVVLMIKNQSKNCGYSNFHWHKKQSEYFYIHSSMILFFFFTIDILTSLVLLGV